MSISSECVECAELDGQGAFILSIVSQFAKCWNFETDDLFQEAVIAYITARHKYDPSRGARSTFVFRVVSNRLRSILLKRRRQTASRNKIPLENVTLGTVDPVTLSPENQQDIHTIYEIVEQRHPGNPRKEQWLRNQLKHRGWKNTKIDQVFSVIKQEICSEDVYTTEEVTV